jgi:GTPase SAR1 family protein
MSSVNIWNEFLSGSSNRTQNEYSTVVIVGDAKSGKTELIEKICADKNLSMKVEVRI